MGHLVLRRRAGEKLHLDTSDGIVTIELLDFRANDAAVSIYAPRSVKILRAEIVGRQPRPKSQQSESSLPAAITAAMLADMACMPLCAAEVVR